MKKGRKTMGNCKNLSSSSSPSLCPSIDPGHLCRTISSSSPTLLWILFLLLF
jgi:hypothetical protein